MIESWFSSPIYVEDNVDKENIKTYKKHIKKYALQTNFLSNSIQNREGIHTSHELIDLVKDPIFTPLKTHILKHNKIFLSALGYDEKTIAGMRISNMWFNVSHTNTSLLKHLHPGSITSGVYYVKSSPKNKILFYAKDSMILPPKNPNNLSYEDVTYECLESRILLFKSNLEHSAPRQEEKEKISISFNIF
jgi:uncharacterized protein (TIGR02466 family)|tara:strand:+ start:5541 stop:6113 length:573 start_codon:yes stop_codon:yes gene_type:complete